MLAARVNTFLAYYIYSFIVCAIGKDQVGFTPGQDLIDHLYKVFHIWNYT